MGGASRCSLVRAWVTSAGNSNTTTAGFLESKDGVINVASTTSNDTKSGFSSYGVEVEVSAPGSSIYNTYSNHGSPSYAWLGGTSMASPHVTGLIGLVRAYNPELEKHKVDSVVIATADNIDAQNPAYIGLLGSGRINARRALEGTPFADFDVDITFGQAPLAVQFTDHSYLNPTAWDWDLGNGDTSTDTNTTTVYTAPGKYTVSLTTQCDAGLKTTTKTDLIYTVVDTVGGDSLEDPLGLLAPGGTLVAIATLVADGNIAARQAAAEAAGKRFVLAILDDRDCASTLERLAMLVQTRRVPAPEVECFPVEQVREAHRKIATGHVRGKLVLKIRG